MSGTQMMGGKTEVGMIRINLDMDMPKECHECPFQLKFKDDEVDAWYMRRCVIMQRTIEYPRPEWCPLKEQEAKSPIACEKNSYWDYVCPKCGSYDKALHYDWNYCPFCGQAVNRE